ncbi:hypothetical protein [Halocella sp. SP3-1]|nr:hypothetical protein [Halocella sp. SP3-1]AZO95160.1 hypothetical protein D7D81_11515 [Halocella sp. SP3-1]MTI60979.1 hypothetical protein [Bacillota bacterium]
MLQEKFGGANGKLKAGLQYFSRNFRIQDPEINTNLQKIAWRSVLVLSFF